MLKSLEDIESFMQTNLLIFAEMIRKTGKGDSVGVVHSTIEAFMVFCRRQREKGKDWLRDLNLESVLRDYYDNRGEEMRWDKKKNRVDQQGNQGFTKNQRKTDMVKENGINNSEF